MYEFIDTTENQNESILPSEALSINGTYIENEIAGYRTLKVEGRESLASEITSSQVGSMNGEYYQEKRDVSREITVTYQLLSSSPAEFREKYNKLCGLLDFEQAQLIFADEQDKYYVGTKSDMEVPEGGRLNVVSSFTIFCADPYKYAVAESSAQNSGSTITVNNRGTKPVPISATAKMKSDNGYFALVLDDRYWQIGKPEEVDGTTEEMSVTLFDDHLNVNRGWAVNKGITPPVTPERLQNGTIGYSEESENEGFAYVSNYASGNSWHGAAITKTVPKDENSELPKNWRATWRFDFNMVGAAIPEEGVGHQSVTFSDEDDNIIVSVVFEDNQPARVLSDMAVYIDQQRVWTTKNTTLFYVTGRGDDGPCVIVEKIGDQINVRFSYADINLSFLAKDPDAKLAKITWYGAAYQSYTNMRNNFFRAINLIKHNVEHFDDIPNYFTNGDKVELEGNTGKVYINGVYNADVVDPGSQVLLLPPGQHTIGIAKSSFSLVPDVTISYRERWI